MSSKKDPELGQKIAKHLTTKGVETPLCKNHTYDAPRAKLAIYTGVYDMLKHLGLNMEDDSLEGTPQRIADMFMDELFIGLDYNNFPKCTAVENKAGYNEMVTIGPIQTYSTCEHHLVTIDGFTWISYVPGSKVLGLSKFARIVNFFARRPQIQERMTEQIFHALCFILKTEDVAVYQKATHYCMKSRGIQDGTSTTTTSKLGGRFMNNATLRNEFLNSVK